MWFLLYINHTCHHYQMLSAADSVWMKFTCNDLWLSKAETKWTLCKSTSSSSWKCSDSRKDRNNIFSNIHELSNFVKSCYLEMISTACHCKLFLRWFNASFSYIFVSLAKSLEYISYSCQRWILVNLTWSLRILAVIQYVSNSCHGCHAYCPWNNWNHGFNLWNGTFSASQILNPTSRWHSCFILINTLFSSVGKVWDVDAKSFFPVHVTSLGSMSWTVTTQFSSYCDFDIRLFPFDTQTCVIAVRIL